MKILYVDDEIDLLELIPEYVDNDYVWELVTTGDEALNKLNNKQYDLVIIDFLPKLKSIELMEYMTQNNIKFILFTGDYELKELPIENVVLKPDVTSLYLLIDTTNKAD